jgi:hypothetical protein
MITAKEAKIKSEFVQKSLHAEEMKIIEKAIGESIDKGETSCSLDFIINTENQTKLKTLGYEVEIGFWRNEDRTIISW